MVVALQVTDVRAEQPWNARSRMDAIVDGNIIPFKAIHLQYLQPIITQYFIDNKSEIWLLFLIAHSKR